MKKVLFIAVIMLMAITAFSQKLTQVIISNYNSSVTLTFLVDETVLVNITTDGKIIEWGTESIFWRGMYNYPPKLDKYMGREEYYPATDSTSPRGKIKYIGRTGITYYTAAENEKWAGKIKTIGPILFDYYLPYEDKALSGNIKNAGSTSFTYFSYFDNTAYKGKLRSVGTTSITYYSSFDDKAFRGKIKSIDRQQLVYYSSYDRREYSGSLKSGYTSFLFNGIKYFIVN